MTKKKVALLQASTTLNYGSMMMVTNFIYYFNKVTNNEYEYYVDNEEEDGIERLIHATGVNNIYRLSSLGYSNQPEKRSYNISSKLINYFWYFKSIHKVFINNKFKDVLFFGGDDLSEYYSSKSLIYSLLKLNKLNENKINIYLVGQTIGPFSSWRKIVSKKVLSKQNIYTRDIICYKYLKGELQLKNIVESADLAFLELPRQNEKLDNFPQLIKDEFFTIVPSGIWAQYTKSKDKYLQNWVGIIKRILLETNYKVALLAHVIKKGSSDADIIKEIINRIDSNLLDRIIVINHKIQPYEARQILGLGKLTISGRMHAAISTFQMKKPAISLSYSVKYDGVIGEELERKDLIIESANDQIWEQENIVDLIYDKIDYVLKNYSELTSQIEQRVKNEEKEALKQIEDIARKISSDNTKGGN